MAKHLLIVAHVPSDNTRRLRDAVVQGARNPEISGVELRVLTPFEAKPDDVLWADAIILGTTEPAASTSNFNRPPVMSPIILA